MKPELFYLALVTSLTGLLWIPYVLDRVAVGGLMDPVGTPDHSKPPSPWALASASLRRRSLPGSCWCAERI